MRLTTLSHFKQYLHFSPSHSPIHQHHPHAGCTTLWLSKNDQPATPAAVQDPPYSVGQYSQRLR